MLGQVSKSFWSGWQGPTKSPKKSKKDRHLYNHWAKASDRIDTLFFVKTHSFLRLALFIASVLRLKLFQQRLKSAHCFHLATLFH